MIAGDKEQGNLFGEIVKCDCRHKSLVAKSECGGRRHLGRRQMMASKMEIGGVRLGPKISASKVPNICLPIHQSLHLSIVDPRPQAIHSAGTPSPFLFVSFRSLTEGRLLFDYPGLPPSIHLWETNEEAARNDLEADRRSTPLCPT
ncbi:hypothetical protein AVEN_12729-1 [Araneus ventricosus]|uniref:Uncharacterized protein n=1 Tax=Araneus ventricosus TaxID=182803 RepID=A0A4Y2ACT2_ARAVE|nr:hypothetical protein AVEN_12729-1 [Araneus ventricosus]